MRVLFTSFAWPSHYYPMAPLGWALRAAGHEVRVASTPALTETIIQTGLPAVSVGTDIDIAGRSKRGELGDWHNEKRWPTDQDKLNAGQQTLITNIANMMFEVAGAMSGDLVDFARAWQPDLLIHDPQTFAGPVAAQALGIPSLAHMAGSPSAPGLKLQESGTPPPPGWGELFARFGVEPRMGPSAWIDPCPPSMRKPAAAARLSVRYVPFNAPGVEPAWLLERSARPRVCITWGTSTVRMMSSGMTELLHQAIDAVTGLDVDVVLAVTAATRRELGTIPPGVRVAESLPLYMLMPSCQAIVHQGGVGTALTAALYGVPQLSVTQIPEQMITGDVFAASGAGRHLLHNESTVERIRAHVVALLEDQSCRDGADRLRAEMLAMPTPAELVPDLLEAAAGHALAPR
ncbi:nucleotide disphospho-sugar-binding domain-containing protein [Nocardia arthritidis]|uniref:DUF1205 domain-containing protein n=1 Tax=Nocardia arthritidis TaxID=228602 RepID=A0A6G9YAI2_9NOCA|nr:nucleotide disphospho-sugar-binding domain-containing protein [Nocardia arthritidis]QIS10053.1 DUF1205 domain-containing protein [Nocardia arthritidis]